MWGAEALRGLRVHLLVTPATATAADVSPSSSRCRFARSRPGLESSPQLRGCTGRRLRRGGEASRLCVKNPAYRLPPPLLSWTAPPPKHLRCPDEQGRKKLLSCKAAMGLDVTPATVVVLSSVLSFAALRTYIYFRLEYIIAAMLGRHVSRGGATVVELNIRGGRSLYYYPADVNQVVAVSSNSNVQLLKNQAARAGVPIQVKTQGPKALGVPSATVDAVVSVLCLCNFPDTDVRLVLREAVRVLKPGKSFIFIESVGVGNMLIRTVRSVFESLSGLVGSKNATRRNLLPLIQDVKDFEELEYEEIFSFVDPHVVGIAKKKLPVMNGSRKEVRKVSKKSKA